MKGREAREVGRAGPAWFSQQPVQSWQELFLAGRVNLSKLLWQPVSLVT